MQRVVNDSISQKAQLEERLMNLSFKDIQSIYRENKILKESLKELKSREILLMAKLQAMKDQKALYEKENFRKEPKVSKWESDKNEIDRLQEEINGSLLELEKSERKVKGTNTTHSKKKNEKLRQEIDILKTQKNFLDSQLEYSEKKSQKKDLIIKKLKTQLGKSEKERKALEKERDQLLIDRMVNMSQLSKDIYETGGQSVHADITLEKNHKPSLLSKEKLKEDQLLRNELERRVGVKENQEILTKLDSMISSIKLIPDLQHIVLSVLDILSANPLISYGNVSHVLNSKNLTLVTKLSILFRCYQTI
jgi:DNA repair exonuclease SbcCD ATPase subunit